MIWRDYNFKCGQNQVAIVKKLKEISAEARAEVYNFRMLYRIFRSTKNGNTFSGSVLVGGAVPGVDVLYHGLLLLATRRNLPLNRFAASVVAQCADSPARVCMRWHSESYLYLSDMNFRIFIFRI